MSKYTIGELPCTCLFNLIFKSGEVLEPENIEFVGVDAQLILSVSPVHLHENLALSVRTESSGGAYRRKAFLEQQLFHYGLIVLPN